MYTLSTIDMQINNIQIIVHISLFYIKLQYDNSTFTNKAIKDFWCTKISGLDNHLKAHTILCSGITYVCVYILTLCSIVWWLLSES